MSSILPRNTQRHERRKTDIPKHFQREELTNDYIIRRTAVDFGIPLITNGQLAERLAQALERIPIDQLRVRAWGEY